MNWRSQILSDCKGVQAVGEMPSEVEDSGYVVVVRLMMGKVRRGSRTEARRRTWHKELATNRGPLAAFGSIITSGCAWTEFLVARTTCSHYSLLSLQ